MLPWPHFCNKAFGNRSFMVILFINSGKRLQNPFFLNKSKRLLIATKQCGIRGRFPNILYASSFFSTGRS